ncbi:ABC transporter permease [Agrococcus sp. SGAir0287]|uniref:ABC transporter permease n=1 Tax=Agrococcus sp. SGAir0287 TaxID=2070347 RepID=UPI0010CD52D9|nr:ABC transporter permease subunit [Agrococcus sp. SGAir0287]QCR19472.1 ABC transporter permease [Agrococcus sp. SGAir0287]
MDWVIANWNQVWDLTLNHARLSVAPIVVGFLVAVPLGRLAAGNRAARGIILSTGSALYAIPSLPLFLILPLILATRTLDEINLTVALTLYAIAIMVRSATDAFQSLPPATIGAATAIGYGRAGRFWRVELPLAGPVLLAGLRVVSVSTVAMVTVGALIGSDNLGYLFTNGRATNNVDSVLAGLVGTVVLAAIFDLVLQLAGRLAMPWRR